MPDKRKPLSDAGKTTEATIDNERMGRNSLQGNDQEQVRNQRQSQPDTKHDADGVKESFEKLDKDKRAREDLGKGARQR